MADRPNVLWLSVHDLNTHLGCMGNPVVKSPNIDRLAERGRLFKNHVCNYPLCGPSRASMLTGKRPDTTQVLDNLVWFRDTLPGVVTLPAHFRANGYRTAKRGAFFHGGLDDEEAWNEGATATGPKGARTPEQQVERESRADRFEPDEEDLGDARTADWAIEMLENDHQERFFVAAGFSKPHVPLTVPKAYFDLYKEEDIQLPEQNPAAKSNAPSQALRPNFDIFIRREAEDEAEARRAILAYYACISFLDAQIGRILDTVDRLGLWDNTVVVFQSDHGFHLGEYGLWSKMTLFEASVRVPVILVVPGMSSPGQPTQRLSEHVDLFPTLVEVCGLPRVAGLEGSSLSGLLEDPGKPWKRAVFSQVRRGEGMGRMARTEGWHYNRWEPNGEEELYQIGSDPFQLRNVANENPQELSAMRKVLDGGWQDAVPSP